MNLIKILIAIIVLCILTPSVFAASTSVTSSFDTSEYYQGKNGAVDVYVTNEGNEYILLEEISINFDWMQTGYAYTLDKTSAPIRIEAGNKVKIGTISFGVASSASIGYHTYQWAISGQENKQGFWGGYSLEAFSTGWFGSSRIYVETPLKPKARDALNSALNDINTARSKNFESSSAKNNLNKATTDYNSGVSAKDAREFSSAINYANSAKKYILDAYPLEQTYQKEKSDAISAKNAAVYELNKAKSYESVDAKNKINEANSHLSIAETRFSSGDFNSAISEYNSAKSFAKQAYVLEQDYLIQKQKDVKAKQNAESTISKVKSKISTIIDLRSEQAINRLKDARTHLNTAENHLATGKFEAAIKEANIASDYSEDALKTEETWRNENPIKSSVKASGFQLILSFLSIISIGYYLRKN
ncbi:MAG: hypothetical protein KAT05_05835 [Spirochaetes bacterium]|nr:hypothetical protein [Spirochaetota bacterium]